MTRRGCGNAQGVGVGAPRPEPLWIPAFAGMTVRGSGRQVLAVMEWRGSRCGGMGLSRKAPTTGCWGCPERRRCSVVGFAPPVAPLGSCLRRNDARVGAGTPRGFGVSGWRPWPVVGLPRPAPVPPPISLRANGRHHPSGFLPSQEGRENRARECRGGWGGSAPPGAPLDTGFRRHDGEGFGAASVGGSGVRVPLRRDGPFSKGPYDGVLGVSGWRPWAVVGLLPALELRVREAPFECPQDRLRQAQGERNHVAALPIRLAFGVSRRLVGWYYETLVRGMRCTDLRVRWLWLLGLVGRMVWVGGLRLGWRGRGRMWS